MTLTTITHMNVISNTSDCAIRVHSTYPGYLRVQGTLEVNVWVSSHHTHMSGWSLFPLVNQSSFSPTQICSVVAFSQTLRRYTSLNHLAQAARAVLQNPSQINQMLADLNRVDFVNIQVGLKSTHIRPAGCFFV